MIEPEDSVTIHVRHTPTPAFHLPDDHDIKLESYMVILWHRHFKKQFNIISGSVYILRHLLKSVHRYVGSMRAKLQKTCRNARQHVVSLLVLRWNQYVTFTCYGLERVLIPMSANQDDVAVAAVASSAQASIPR